MAKILTFAYGLLLLAAVAVCDEQNDEANDIDEVDDKVIVKAVVKVTTLMNL